MLKNKILSSLSGQEEKLYVDDCFSTYLYTGNGSTQTINNGIDLAGKGGMVWIKARDLNYSNVLGDTARGIYFNLSSDMINYPLGSTGITSVNSNGFTLDSTNIVNLNSYKFSSWTFRKAPKFFDVMTYTGDNLPNRHIPHSLGIEPGMIIVRASQAYSSWSVYHRSLGPAFRCILGEATASSDFGGWGDTSPTSTEFTVNNYGGINGGGQHLAYLFAHDTSPDGIVQCGSYIGNGSATGPEVTLGWEPQYLMIKNASGTGSWQIIDNMRCMPVGSADATLQANLSNTESSVDYVSPIATGFQVTSASSEVNTSGSTYIYMAIRRPNKPPKTGAEVYNAIARTGNRTAYTITGSGFPVDLIFNRERASVDYGYTQAVDRLRGPNMTLSTALAANEGAGTDQVMGFDAMDGYRIGSGTSSGRFNYNLTTNGYIDHLFRRAPGFFSSFAYTGTGANRTTTHDLSVTPDLLIVKSRSANGDWQVWYNGLAASEKLVLNSNAAKVTDTTAWNSTLPTATNITVGTSANTNANGATYIAYAFGNLPGISKVGSYTGNGTSQAINCGFTTGCRFFLVKATSTTGSWWVFDSARGIVSSFDPALQLNSTAAEITSADAVDNDPSGIIVNQEATCSINASGVSYIFLAIA